MTGLLTKMQKIERCGRGLIEEGALLEKERAGVVAEIIAELVEVSWRPEEGLGLLKRQVKEVFHRMAGRHLEVLRTVCPLCSHSQSFFFFFLL